MKKVLISLSLLCASLPAFSMASQAGGAGSAAYQEKIAVTRDGKRIPISGTIFKELRSGLFADFLYLHLPKENLLATRFQDFERGSLTTVDTQELWHDLAAEWDSLTLTGDGDHDFPLDIIDAHTLETLFTLAHHPEEFQRIWARCSIAQQIQLSTAADFLVLHSPLRTAIINATAHIIPAIGQLSKDEFLALLPRLRSMVTHCLPARCALAHQFAFNGIQPHSTQLPLAERIWFFEIVPNGTLAYITDHTDNHRLYFYNPTTGTPTLIRDHVLNFHFAPDGTLAYKTDYTDNYRLYLYNPTTRTSTQISDHVDWQRFNIAPNGTLYLQTIIDGHLLRYNFTHELDTVQQLILLFVLSHERAGHPCSFTASEMAALEKQFYAIPVTPPLTPEELALPEEARRPTAEQLRTSSGLRSSLLDMPEELLAHVHIAAAPTAARAGGASAATTKRPARCTLM